MGNEKLRRNIRALRKAYGETQDEVALAIGYSSQAVSAFETGQREINQEAIISLAKHFSVSVEELLSCDFSNQENIEIDSEYLFVNCNNKLDTLR